MAMPWTGAGFEKAGVGEIKANKANINYLKTKRDKMGHLILIDTKEKKVRKKAR